MFDFLPNYYTTYLEATVTTLKVSLIALLVGLILGIVICLAKISTFKVLNIIAAIYVEVIRNTPILVQIMIIYFALPEIGISFTPFMSAIIALSINSGAYVSEIFRSGILAIDKGQMEAGRSLGLSYFQTMKLVILPQALKNSLPALGNEFISLVKESSIVYFVGVADIMFTANTVKNATYQTFGPYLVAAAIYFIITSILSLLVGLILGIVVCLAKISTFKVLNVIAAIYVEIIRNTPILVQIMIIYFALPEIGISFTPFMSAIIALSINSGAYVSEIFRSGILAIDKGQMEAGRSLGLSYFQTMKLIILPQALKNSLPALGNEFISLVKESSIVYFVGVEDIMFTANTVKNATYQTFGPYLVAAAIYFIITSILSLLVKRLEKKLTK